MKPTLLLAMLSLGFVAPKAFALSELETLRVKCGDQERQIRRLEQENAKLRTTKNIPSPTVSKSEAALSAQASGRTHKLEEGETYTSISRKYKIPVDSLIAANPDAKPTALHTGQIIRMPGNTSGKSAKLSEPTSKQKSETQVASTGSKPKPAAGPVGKKPVLSSATPVSMVKETPSKPKTSVDEPEVTDTTSSQKHSSSPNPEKKIRSVKIEGETTYGEFAAKHGTDTGRLNDLNGLDLTNATVLAKGSELYVPAQP